MRSASRSTSPSPAEAPFRPISTSATSSNSVGVSSRFADTDAGCFTGSGDDAGITSLCRMMFPSVSVHASKFCFGDHASWVTDAFGEGTGSLE